MRFIVVMLNLCVLLTSMLLLAGIIFVPHPSFFNTDELYGKFGFLGVFTTTIAAAFVNCLAIPRLFPCRPSQMLAHNVFVAFVLFQIAVARVIVVEAYRFSSLNDVSEAIALPLMCIPFLIVTFGYLLTLERPLAGFLPLPEDFPRTQRMQVAASNVAAAGAGSVFIALAFLPGPHFEKSHSDWINVLWCAFCLAVPLAGILNALVLLKWYSALRYKWALICVNAAALTLTLCVGLTGIGASLSEAVGYRSSLAVAFAPVFGILLVGFHTALSAMSDAVGINDEAARPHLIQPQHTEIIRSESAFARLTKGGRAWFIGGVAVLGFIIFPLPWPPHQDCTRLSEGEMLRRARQAMANREFLERHALTVASIEAAKLVVTSMFQDGAIFELADGKRVTVSIYENCYTEIDVFDPN